MEHNHCPESTNSRADKMSGHPKDTRCTKKFIKWFYGKKRRRFLNNEYNWDKI